MDYGLWNMGFIRGVNPPVILIAEFGISPAFTVFTILVGLGLIPYKPAREYRHTVTAENLPLLKLRHSLSHFRQRSADKRGDIINGWRNTAYSEIAIRLTLVHVPDQFDPKSAGR